MKKVTVIGAIIAVAVFASAAYAQQNRSSQDEAQQNAASSQQNKQEQTASAQNAETVRKVQEALNEKGYNVGPVDGKWGTKSKQAMKKFQKSEGIQANGKIDTQTLAKLGVSSQAAGAGGQGSMSGEQGGTGGQSGQQSSTGQQQTGEPARE